MVREERSETTFKFGNGELFKSIERVTLPAVIAYKNVFLATEVIKNKIPMLLIKETMKSANTYIDFSKDKITVFNEEEPVKFSSSGHYCITIENVKNY